VRHKTVARGGPYDTRVGSVDLSFRRRVLKNNLFAAARGRALGATAGALLAAGVSQGLTTVSGVLAARLLGVSDRGHLAFFILVPLIISHLGLAIPVAATYGIARAPERAAAIVRVLRAPALRHLAALTAIDVAILLVALRFQDGYVRQAALLMLPAVPFLLLQQYGLAILQGRQSFRAFNVLRVCPAAGYALAAVLLLATRNDSLVWFTGAWIVATGAAAFLTIVVSLRDVRSTRTEGGPPAKDLLSVGWRSLLGTTSPVEYFQVDQVMVTVFLSTRALGLYVAANAFTNLVRFIGQSIGTVAYPSVAAVSAVLQRRRLWRFTAFNLVISGFVVAVLEVFVDPLLPLLFGDDFEDAVPVARILLLAAFFFSVRRVLTESSRGAGYAVAGSLAEMTSWVVLALAAVAFVPLYELNGIALSLTVAAASSLVLLSLIVALRPPDRPARGIAEPC
jgi:O-antigen/teichoic acid export membrane protein